MPKSRAAELIKAADKARRADRRVSDAQRSLTVAVRARDRAESQYLQLVKASIDCGSEKGDAGKEGVARQEG